MIKTLTFIAFFHICLTSIAQECNWIINPKGTNTDVSNDISTDDSANIYIAGYFRSSSMDVGNTTVFNTGGTDTTGNPCYDFVIAKIDSTSFVRWARSEGETGQFESATGIAADNDHNVFVCGWFTGTAFNIGSSTLTSAGGWDVFVAKYDPYGNVLWAQRFGGNSDDLSNAIAVDDSGNVYVTGYYWSGSVLFGITTLTNSGSADAFLTKFDNNGNVIWAKKIGGGGLELGRRLAADDNYNVYITGNYSSSITIGSTPLTPSGSSDVFTAKITSGGDWLWAKKGGGNKMEHANGIATFGNTGCAITGDYYSNPINFSGTTLTNPGNNTFDAFVVRYDESGNLMWAKRAGGTMDDIGRGVAFDSEGYLYATGEFMSTSLSFGGPSVSNTDVNGVFSDLYLGRFNSYGTNIWLKHGVNTYSDIATDVTVDSAKSIYITAFYEGISLVLDNYPTVNTGYTDIIVAKYEYAPDSSSGVQEGSSKVPIARIWPNPASDFLNLTTATEIFDSPIIRITDITGREILKESLENFNEDSDYSISLGDIPDGLYILILSGTNQIWYGKFAIRH